MSYWQLSSFAAMMISNCICFQVNNKLVSNNHQRRGTCMAASWPPGEQVQAICGGFRKHRMALCQGPHVQEVISAQPTAAC